MNYNEHDSNTYMCVYIYIHTYVYIGDRERRWRHRADHRRERPLPADGEPGGRDPGIIIIVIVIVMFIIIIINTDITNTGVELGERHERPAPRAADGRQLQRVRDARARRGALD